MSRMLEHTIGILTQQRWIRVQTIVTLYFARTYKAVRENYLRNFHTASRRHREQPPAPNGGFKRRSSATDACNEKRLAERIQEVQDDDDDHRHDWDWTGYPHLWKPLAYLQWLSTSYMLYICLREFLIMPLADRLVQLLGLTKPGNCYFLGRLLMADQVKLDAMNASLIALAQITWRAMQRFGPRPYQLNMFHFLMMSDQDVERFHRQLETTRNRRKLDQMIGHHNPLLDADEQHVSASSSLLPRNSVSRSTSALDTQKRKQYSDAERDTANMSNEQQQQQCPSHDLGGDERIMSQRDRDRFFTSVLCFKITNKCTVDYKLRPHRTPQARAQLRKQVAETALFCSVVFGGAFLVIFTYVCAFSINDHRYLRVHPGCDAELERAKLANKLGPWSYSFRHHQRWALLFDILENVIVWVDSGVALIFVCAASYVLNFDILQYWKHLNGRAERLYEEMRAEADRRYAQQRSEYLQLNWRPDSSSDGQYVTSTASASSLRRNTDGATTRRISFSQILARERDEQEGEEEDATRRMEDERRRSAKRSQQAFGQTRTNDRELDRTAHELRAELYDFFHEIDRVDLLVSDIITVAIVTWLLLFSFVAHFAWEYYLKSGDLDLLVRVYSVELFAFSGITLMSFNLLSLHKSCMRTYQTLCSLMAHDTGNNKCAYLGVLEFFTVRKRTAYTLFQTVPYTGNTYLSIFSWSITCYFLLSSLLRGHRY